MYQFPNIFSLQSYIYFTWGQDFYAVYFFPHLLKSSLEFLSGCASQTSTNSVDMYLGNQRSSDSSKMKGQKLILWKIPQYNFFLHLCSFMCV